MADYPGAIPTIAANKTNATVMATDHPAHHNKLAEELVAALNELGINPSGSFATVVLRLAAAETALTTHEAATDPHTGYQKESEKGAASGYASLDSAGQIPVVQFSQGTPPLNTQSGTTYTLALTDAGAVVGINNSAANTLTIPTNATVAFPVGTQIAVRQPGAGQTTIAPAGGVTLLSRGSVFKLAGQYAYATLLKTSLNTWELSGDIVA